VDYDLKHGKLVVTESLLRLLSCVEGLLADRAALRRGVEGTLPKKR